MPATKKQNLTQTLRLRIRRGRRRLSDLLRPLPGRKIPSELKAGRVGVLARRLEGVYDPEFKDLLRRIDGHGTIHPDNSVALFFDGTEAMDAMLTAIEKAKVEILLESYIFDDDTSGQRFFEALKEAAARGVDIKILADAYGSFSTDTEFWEELEATGIEVQIYHPLLSKIRWHAFRDHRKIMVTDRRLAFTGGMNIADEYLSPEKAQKNELWRDSHLRVTGPAVTELVAVFEESWHRASEQKLEPWVNESEKTEKDQEGKEPPGEVEIMVLESRPFRGHHETASALAATVESAQESVWLTNAYFAPNRMVIRILQRTAKRGIDVRLLLAGKTDFPIVRHAGHGFFKDLLESGVRIFEYQPSVLHAKTLVVDGHVSVVGSSNLDLRSFHYNAECNLLMLSDDIGERMREQFEKDLETAEEIDLESWNQRDWKHKLIDYIARHLTPLL